MNVMALPTRYRQLDGEPIHVVYSSARFVPARVRAALDALDVLRDRQARV
jgi:hypothetical protein